MHIYPKDKTSNEIYHLMTASILPRPIAFVSTISKKGISNIAPFSYFTGISSKPATLGFSVSFKGVSGERKDTLVNILDTGEFVVNVVSETFLKEMNSTATPFSPEIDEFETSYLGKTKAHFIRPYLLTESKISMECKFIDSIQVGTATDGGSTFVIGEILCFHIEDAIYKNDRINTQLLSPIGRLSGSEYSRQNDRIIIKRK